MRYSLVFMGVLLIFWMTYQLLQLQDTSMPKPASQIQSVEGSQKEVPRKTSPELPIQQSIQPELVFTFSADILPSEQVWVQNQAEEALDFLKNELGFSLENSASIQLNVLNQKEFVKRVASKEIQGVFTTEIILPFSKKEKAFKQVLLHELVHGLFFEYKKLRPIPRWFEEGVAQLVSCGQNCFSSLDYVSRPVFLSLSELRAGYLRFSKAKTRLAYRQSLFMVKLLQKKIGNDGFVELVASLADFSILGWAELLAGYDLSESVLYDHAKNVWNNKEIVYLDHEFKNQDYHY